MKKVFGEKLQKKLRKQACIAMAFALLVSFAFSTKYVTADSTESTGFSDESSDVVLTQNGGGGVYSTLSELEGKTIGVAQGSYFDVVVQEMISNITLRYYKSNADMYNALRSGKIDAFVEEEPIIRRMMLEKEDLTYVQEYLYETQFGFAFSKTDEGAKLNEQLSAYIRELKSDGTLEEIDSLWFGEDDSKKVLEDYTQFPDTNGTITYALFPQMDPFCYLKDDLVIGYDLDIISRFCKEYGYRLETEIMDFDGIIPSVQSGKCDFGGAGMTITEERSENVDFSEPYYTSNSVLAVMKKTTGTNPFFSSVKESFVKTFVREHRYKLFLSGIAMTLLITVLSVLIGTILGFGGYMLVRNGNRAANLIADLLSGLIQGMPAVVLLMILYYIIFGKTELSGTFVSVIAFSLVFATGVLSILKTAVGAIDNGQFEAACALGYSDRRAFFRIILPQALPYFLPHYKGEVVALLKATAIVGYIAVQDLTKMGDIVRGRTYEAFFPLIVVAVIYFILEGILIYAINRIEININPKRRKNEMILKGVKTDD